MSKVIVNGTFFGGEIEPGVFHEIYPPFPGVNQYDHIPDDKSATDVPDQDDE